MREIFALSQRGYEMIEVDIIIIIHYTPQYIASSNQVKRNKWVQLNGCVIIRLG